MVDVMYGRQANLGLHPPEKATVIGCGGVGTWVAIDLAMVGVPILHLFDDDDIEAHNLNRLPFGETTIGKPKTEVLKKFIKKIRPHTRIMMHGKFSSITQSLLAGHVVDCTDKLRVQAQIQAACDKLHHNYYRVGYDGHHITIIDGQHATAPKAEAVWEDGSGHEGYTTVDSWVVPPQVAAAMLTTIICDSRKEPCAPIQTNVVDMVRRR